MNDVKKIAIVTNSVFNFINYRLPLVEEFIKKGADVYVLLPDAGYQKHIADALNIKTVNWIVDRKSYNLLSFFHSYLQLKRIVKENNFDYLLSFTLKPVLYSCLLPKQKVLGTITGFGEMRKNRIIFRIIVAVLQLILRIDREKLIVVQNSEDFRALENKFLLKRQQLNQTVGSGIIPKKICKEFTGKKRIIWVGRSLKTKGIAQYNRFVDIVSREYPGKFEYSAFVKLDSAHQDSLTKDQILEYFGERIKTTWNVDNVEELLPEYDVLFFHSDYYEGFPKVIMEAINSKLYLIVNEFHGFDTLLEDGKNCVVLKTVDTENALRAVEKIINLNVSEMCSMEAEYERAISEIDVRKIAASYYKWMER